MDNVTVTILFAEELSQLLLLFLAVKGADVLFRPDVSDDVQPASM